MLHRLLRAPWRNADRRNCQIVGVEMKMSKEHLNVLKERVAHSLPLVPAHREVLRADPRVKDLEKRVLWDLYYTARMWQLYSPQEWDYKDVHIETAMRAIMAEGIA